MDKQAPRRWGWKIGVICDLSRLLPSNGVGTMRIRDRLSLLDPVSLYSHNAQRWHLNVPACIERTPCSLSVSPTQIRSHQSAPVCPAIRYGTTNPAQESSKPEENEGRVGKKERNVMRRVAECYRASSLLGRFVQFLNFLTIELSNNPSVILAPLVLVRRRCAGLRGTGTS